MITQWIVVACRGGARVFERKQHTRPLRLVKKFNNPLATLRNRGLTSDRSGNGKSTFSSIRSGHALTGNKSPHEHAAERFATKMGDYLETGRQQSKFDQLVLVAEPHFLGMLKSAMNPATVRMVTDCVHKDLGKLPADQVPLVLGIQTKSGLRVIA